MGGGGGDRSLLFVVGPALLGTLLILLREINYGPGVNWDSVMYMSVAENLVAGKGFATFQGSPLTIWPPLFPMLLTPGVFLGFDAQDSAGFVNAAAFGLTILFSGLWLRNRIASGTLILWATLAVMLSVPLTLAAVVVLSESPFILFSLLALIWIEKFLQSHAHSSLIWAAIFTALACLTRYMGGTLAIAVALLLLLQRGVPPRTKIVQLAVYAFIAVTPVLLWLSRNMLVAGSTTGGLLGGYWEPVTPLLENGRFTAQTLLDWIVPASELPPGIQDIAAVLALATALVLSASAAAQVLLRHYRSAGAAVDLTPLTPFGVFSLVYIVLLIASGAVVEIGRGNVDRYLSPVYVPLVFITAFILDKLLKHGSLGKKRKRIGLLLPAVFFLWLTYPIAKNVWYASIDLERGRWMADKKWANSELLQHIRTPLAPGAIWYTNHQAEVYFHTGTVMGELPPQWQLHDLKQALPTLADEVWIAYFFDNYGRPSPTTQIESSGFEPVVQATDGVLYHYRGGKLDSGPGK